MDEMDALGVSQATYGGGVDPGMAGDFTPSASDAAQQAAAVSDAMGSMGQGTGTGGGFLGEGVPTGISGWDYQTTSGQTLSGLRDLQAQGLGSQMIPSGQTVNQAVASLNLARGLDFAAPYAVQAIPGVGSILTAARVAQGGFRELFNPFGNIDMIRDAVTRNQMERQTAQQAAFTARTNPEGGLTGGVGGVVGGAGSFSGDGGMSVTPAISPTLGNIPGGAAGLSTGLPGGRGYSGTAAGQVGAAGALDNLGEEEDEEERARKQATGLFSTSKTFAEGGMVGPGGMPMFGGMPDPNRVTPAAGLREQPMAAPMNPQMAGMQARQFAQQNPQQLAEIRQEIMEALQSGELQPQSLNMIVQLAQVVAQNPDMYPYARNFLIQQDIMDEADLPQQYSPAVAFLMNLVAEAARGVSGSAPAAAGAAPPVASMARGGTVPNSKKPSGGVVIEAHEGEYVIPAHIVRQKGTEFFDNLIGKNAKAERSAA
jgi:hypothetical protein